MRLVAAALIGVAWPSPASAHEGPPFPIVNEQVAGPYRVSIWTDPDTTDDGSAGGRFWITLHTADGGAVPASTRARVTIGPAGEDRVREAGAGARESGEARLRDAGYAEPVNGQIAQQFIALVMDHEGPFAVHLEVNGELGSAALSSEVDATYDSRPPPLILLLTLAPFAAVGFLWIKLLLRRRRARV